MSSEAYMRLAITEATKAMGKTHPNPAVGAIIIHGGEVVARGHTQPAGEAHAEIGALKAFKEGGFEADDSTLLIVTLEPCSTTGRTGACTEAIVSSGIRRLVIGATDPNPAHSGKGFKYLRTAGLQLETGVLDKECTDLNLIFNWQMRRDQPFFAGKVATTLDGRIATRGGLSKWITGPEARADVHHWRRYFPAIAAGAGTILADDPSLTARIEGESEWCPIRFVFDRNLITFKDGLCKVYSDQWKDRTIVVTNRRHISQIKKLEDEHGLNFWALEESMEDGGLTEFSTRCKEAGITGVFLEGGAHLLSSFLQYRFLHYMYFYRAPKLLADTSGLAPFMGQEPVSMVDAFRLGEVRHATFAEDQLMRGFVIYPEGENT